MPSAWAANPILTTVALSRRLPREAFGPDARVPTIARWIEGTLPQVHRLHIPDELVLRYFAADLAAESADPPDPSNDPDEAGDPRSDP